MRLRRHPKMQKVLLSVMAAFLVLVITGCPSAPEKAEEEGSMILRVFEHSDYSIRSIIPDLDMDIYQYVVSIDGMDNFTLIKSEITTLAIDRVPLGAYSIAISGQNANFVEIGYGSDSFVIEAGLVTQVEITIEPLAGDGTLTLEVSWSPPEIIGMPSVVSTMSPVSTMIPEDISSAHVVTASSTDYNDLWGIGWYVLTYVLQDDLSSVYGFAEAVRIVKNELSEGIMALTIDDITGAVGEIDLVVFEDMQNVIDIELTGVLENLSEMSTMEVTANVSESVDFFWFLSGVPVGSNSNTIVIDGTVLGQGNYRIDCVVKSTNRLSSAGASFSVVEDFEIVFTCDGLRHAVAMCPGVDADPDDPNDPIYLSEVLTITNLGANGLDVTNLVGLEYFTNMVGLTVGGSSVIDISPIAELTQLTRVKMNTNFVVDTLPLSLLVNLVELEFLYNQITDLAGIVNAVDGGLTGCTINVTGNPLSAFAISTQIPYIISAGNTVVF